MIIITDTGQYPIWKKLYALRLRERGETYRAIADVLQIGTAMTVWYWCNHATAPEIDQKRTAPPSPAQ